MPATDPIADRYDAEIAAFAARYAERPPGTTIDRVAQVAARIRPDLPRHASREIARKVLARWETRPPDDETMQAMLADLVAEVRRWGRPLLPDTAATGAEP